MGIVQFYTDHIEKSQLGESNQSSLNQANSLINGDKPIAGRVEWKVGYKYFILRGVSRKHTLRMGRSLGFEDLPKNYSWCSSVRQEHYSWAVGVASSNLVTVTNAKCRKGPKWKKILFNKMM